MALKSVFAQTYSDWELLLLNDNSSDGALNLALRLDDKRVRVLNDGFGKGLSPRLNEVVRAARGKYFVRMDADDVMHPRRLERQLAVLENQNDNAVAGSAAYSINLRNEVIGIRPPQSGQRTDFGARHSFHHPTLAAATSWFVRNPYSEHSFYSRAEDAELWCRTAQHSKFICLPEPLLFYREATSLSIAYLQTELGMIHLLRERFSTPRAKYLWLLTKELTKLWTACVLEALGKGSLWVKQRYKRIDPDSQAEAQRLLHRIDATPLPLIR